MTHEEHTARAMLLGMCYHHGNGDPFYYKMGTDNVSMYMVDANTLEPIVGMDGSGVNWEGMKRRGRAKMALGYPYG